VEVKRVAGELKRQLSDFLRGENRPDLRLIHDGMAANPMKRSGDTLHVIPRHFVTQLQNFVKSPATDNRPVSMSAILLLCPHKRMMYNLEAQIIIDSSVDLVWPQEYQVLERNVEADKRVVVRFVNDDGEEDEKENTPSITQQREIPMPNGHHPPPPSRPRLVYDPPLCPECSEIKLKEKKLKMYEFVGEKIFIRKLGDRDADFKLDHDDDAFKVGGGSGGAGNGVNGVAAYENDPEFQPGLFVESGIGKKRAGGAPAADAGPMDVKRRRSESPTTSSSSSTSTSNNVANGNNNNNNNSGIQMNGDHRQDTEDLSQVLATLGLPTSFGPRSAAFGPGCNGRTRKRRHDKELLVSSSDTLKDLKKKIFTQFQIAPFDQNLHFDEGKEKLCGDEKTLGELGVTPHCLILVRGDKPLNGAASSLTAADVKAEEEVGQAGFSGTKLCNGGSI